MAPVSCHLSLLSSSGKSGAPIDAWLVVREDGLEILSYQQRTLLFKTSYRRLRHFGPVHGKSAELFFSNIEP